MRPISKIAKGAAALNGTGPARKSLLRRSELKGDRKWARGSEYISDLVFDAGCLSALTVLATSGNAAQADPAEREAERRCNRTVFEKHGGCFET